MAEYVQAPQFGDAGDYSLSSLFDYSSGGTDYPSSYPSSPGVTTGPEGSGASADWTSVIAAGLNAAAAIIPVVAAPSPVVAAPLPPTVTSAPAGGLLATPGGLGLGSISPVMLIGAGVLAYFALKKK